MLVRLELAHSASARAVFRNERNTLQATALLHDALLDPRTLDAARLHFGNPARFFAYASRVIRNRLLNHVRAPYAAKRGGPAGQLSLHSLQLEGRNGLSFVDAVAQHDILERLLEYDEELWTVPELKFFCGLTNAVVAATSNRGLSSVGGELDI